MQKKKGMKLLFFLFALAFCVSVVFAYSIFANNIGYNPTDSNWNVDNVSTALDQLRDKFGRESDLISSVDFTIGPANRNITVNVTAVASNSSDILGYHVFAVDGNDNIYSTTSNTTPIVINNLNVNTTYSVRVVAYDKYDHYKESIIKPVSTLANPENLVPILTSNTSGGGVAFATYTANGRSAYEAFDGVIDPPTAYGSRPGYMVSSTTTNQIGYDFGVGNEKMVTKFVYYGQPNDANCRYKTITLEYSDNGSTWTSVQTYTPTNPTSYSTVADLAETFEVTVPVTYHRYWRINGTNTGYSWSGLIELQFWGY